MIKLLKRIWAKRLSLKVWGWLKDHPKVEFKPDLPNKLYKKIENLENRCPLCEIKSPGFCESVCPLDCKSMSEFNGWANSGNNYRQRKQCATNIYNKIKAWRVWK
jgi:ferredoxin